jgi:hypothetical protein
VEGSGVIPLFAGFDPREEIGYHTFASSVIHRATEPVAIAPVDQKVLRKVWGAGHKDGSNSFIYTRFLVPYLMGYQGFAIFADGADMICLGDIAELWAWRDPYKAVQVVKHDYKTKHPRKYVGTRMESDNPDYPRKNWSSLMLINCAHYNWRKITPEAVEKMTGPDLHRFGFIDDRFIGELPVDWNWLADEFGANPDAKLLHWTAGIPGFPRYAHAPHADDWSAAATKITHASP